MELRRHEDILLTLPSTLRNRQQKDDGSLVSRFHICYLKHQMEDTKVLLVD